MTVEPHVDLAAIGVAREAIAGRVHRTPLLSSTAAAAVLGRAAGIRVADDRLYLKAEHLQKTGSFKPRGMTARVAALTADERRRGIITVSAGNAAQGYAYAGATLGVPVTVVMPASAVRSKAQAAAGYGARVVLEGEVMSETFAALDRIRDEEGLVFCHPFDDLDVIAGHASVGLEILEDLPEVDVVVVGIGGGGLISGIAVALKELRPAARLYGVEPETSDAISQALAAGHTVRIQPASVADGLNAPFAGELTLPLIRRYVDDVIRLDDATILAGLRFALERMKQVVEPAGAAALAATLTGRVPIRGGDRVAVVLSGGNVELGRLGELIERAAVLP
jgi:threonine dehydratase